MENIVAEVVELMRPYEDVDPVDVAALRGQVTEWNNNIGTREKVDEIRGKKPWEKRKLPKKVKTCFDWGVGVDRQYRVRYDETTKDQKPPLKDWQLRVLRDAKYPFPKLLFSGGGGVNAPTEGGHDRGTLEKPLPESGDPKRKLEEEGAQGDASGSGSEKKTRR